MAYHYYIYDCSNRYFCWLLICTVVHHAPFFHFVHNTYKIMILIFFSFISYNQHCYSVNGDNKYAFEFFHYFGCVIRGTNSLPFASVWVHSRFLVGSMLLIGLVFCFFCLCPMSCVPNVASFSGLSILDCPLDFLKCLFTCNDKCTFLVICFMFQYIRLVIRHIRFHIWPFIH